MGILSFFNNSNSDKDSSIVDGNNKKDDSDNLNIEQASDLSESVEVASKEEAVEPVDAANIVEADIQEQALAQEDELFEYELEKPAKPDGFYIAEEGEKLAGTGLFGKIDDSEADFAEDDLISASDSEAAKSGFLAKLASHKIATSIIGVAVVAAVSAGIIIGINIHNKNQSAFAQANAVTTTVDFQTIAQPTNPAVDLTAEEEFELVDPAEYAEEDVYPVNDSAGYGEDFYVDYYEPASGNYFGIDVSQWQGYIDWNQVAASGVKFAFIRVGFRGWGTGTLVPDARAEYNMAAASAAGINVGVYFYSTAVNYEEGVQEGKWVSQFIRNYNITYPVVCDYEDYVNVEPDGEHHRSNFTDYNSRTQAIMGFLDAVSAHGYQGMVYASKSFLTNDFNTQAFVNKGYKVWVAHYPDPPYPETSHTSYSATSYNIWQFTNKGHIPGISGDVDLDFAYFGSASDDLLKETTTTQAPTSTTSQPTTTAQPESSSTTKPLETSSDDTSTDPNAGQNNNAETTTN